MPNPFAGPWAPLTKVDRILGGYGQLMYAYSNSDGTVTLQGSAVYGTPRYEAVCLTEQQLQDRVYLANRLFPFPGVAVSKILDIFFAPPEA